MPSSNTTLVAASLGAGKTTWIRQQVEPLAGSALYLGLGANAGSVDGTYLAVEVPGGAVLPPARPGRDTGWHDRADLSGTGAKTSLTLRRPHF